jgi:cysteine desulfurase
MGATTAKYRTSDQKIVQPMSLTNTLNVSFPGVSGRALLAAVESAVAASVGSACHSENDAVSGVLAAMGVTPGQAMGAVRLSIGRFTTAEEVSGGAHALIAGWRKIAAENQRTGPLAQSAST